MSTQGRIDAKRSNAAPSFRLCSLCALALKMLTVAILSVPGLSCGKAAIKTHPVRGKVEVKDGDAAMLTGSTVQLVQEADETIRPYGNIDASGNFMIKTL